MTLAVSPNLAAPRHAARSDQVSTRYDRDTFRKAVTDDYNRRRSLTASLVADVVEGRALGHPLFDRLPIGGRQQARMASVFLDLTNFTQRTFWDDESDVVDLANAVLTGFIDVVHAFGGYPLGLRGDGLFAGFTVDSGDPKYVSAMALAACAAALDATEHAVNPWLATKGMAPIQARAGVDYGTVTFVRIGKTSLSEVNALGFATNFAAKCEKEANSWEVVAGEGLYGLFPASSEFSVHPNSPKRYTRDGETRSYRFYDFRWRSLVPEVSTAAAEIGGRPAASIGVR